MMILDATTKKIQVVLAGAKTTNDCPFVASYVDVTATAYTPGEQDGVTNGATAVDVVAAPAAATKRQVKLLTVHNADTAAVTVSVLYNNNATTRVQWKGVLAVGDTLAYTDGEGFAVTDANGNRKIATSYAAVALSSLTLTAGTGLTGGGDLTANRTFAVTGNLATLSALADAAGWLHSTGAGVYAWSTPAPADLGLATGLIGGYAVGDLLYASGAAALSKLAAVAVGSVLISKGTTTAPEWNTLTGITGVGALNAGSITSGFGAIDIGADALTCGDATVSGLALSREGSGYDINQTLYSTGGISTLWRRARGSAAIPSKVLANDQLGNLLFSGHDDTAFRATVSIKAYAAEDYTSIARGSYLRFATTAIGDLTRTERWEIGNAGHLLAVTDNAYDIGASGASRPRDLFISRNASIAGTGHFDGLLTAGLGLTVTSGQTLTLTGATITGLTGSSSIVTVGALTAGSIGGSFGAINIGANALTCGAVTSSGNISGTTGLFNGATGLDVDATADSGIIGKITDTGWALYGVGGRNGTGQGWSLGAAGTNLYLGSQDGTNANSMAAVFAVAMATKYVQFYDGITATTVTASGAFGCNSKTAQTAYASGGALAAYGTGVFGFDSGANASALYAMVVAIRAALVADGIMS